MSIEKTLESYKSKFYTYMLFTIFVVIESFGLLWFVKNEKLKVAAKYEQTAAMYESAKSEIERINASIQAYNQNIDAWNAIPPFKKEASKRGKNDMIVFLNSLASSFGLSDFVVEVVQQNAMQNYVGKDDGLYQTQTSSTLPSLLGAESLQNQNSYYEKVYLNINFKALNEPLALMFLDSINDDQMIFVTKYVKLEKVTPNKLQKITDFVRGELEDGTRHSSLPGLVMANVYLEYYIIRK